MGFARTVASAQGSEIELDGALLPSVIAALLQLCGDHSSAEVCVKIQVSTGREASADQAAFIAQTTIPYPLVTN